MRINPFVPAGLRGGRSVNGMETLPRSRLESNVPLYRRVADLADRLDHAAYDLWAANLRACLEGDSAAQIVADLGLELHRLRQSAVARRLRLEDTVEEVIATVEAAVGRSEHEHLPLYCALKDLLDTLRLEGGTWWLRRLEAAGGDQEASDAVLVTCLAALLDEMAPGASGVGAPGVPSSAGPRIKGVRQRLPRARDSAALARCLRAALRPIR
jgi:hypothetical protein